MHSNARDVPYEAQILHSLAVRGKVQSSCERSDTKMNEADQPHEIRRPRASRLQVSARAPTISFGLARTTYCQCNTVAKTPTRPQASVDGLNVVSQTQLLPSRPHAGPYLQPRISLARFQRLQ